MQICSNIQNETAVLISFAKVCRGRRHRRLGLRGGTLPKKQRGWRKLKKKWGEGEEAGEENFYVPFFNSKFSQTCLALIFNSYFHYSLFAL